MTLRLRPGEPQAGPWQPEALTSVPADLIRLVRLGGDANVGRRPVVLAVDGRSSSGKTTLAARLQQTAAGSAVVHTDDIAWRHSRFGWSGLLIDGVLGPARAGQAVAFRPPAWVEAGRQGAVEVPAGCPLLVIEGVGAARRESADLIDAAVWVQSDEAEIERRSLARIGTPGNAPTVQDWRDWMAEELPFVADQRPWERADLVICGSPQVRFDAATELLVAPRPGPA